MKRPLLLVGLLVLLLLGAGSYAAWRVLYRPNVTVFAEGPAYLYIRTGTGFSAVLDSLKKQQLLLEPATFEWTARQHDYPAHVKAGRYRLDPELSNLDLVKMLAQGRQDTVQFELKPFHYLDHLPPQVSRQLETDPFKLQLLLGNNADLLARFRLDTCTIRTLFIPGRYRLLWNTSAPAFLDTVAATYRRFWTAERRARADSLKMTQVQVSVLASIVQRETAQPTDKPLIAAVYLNRLRNGQPLQADPTLLWPLHGLGTRKRVLNVDKKVDSPYNTYRHKGLPPGPITTPLPSSLNAVLRPAHNKNLFFCARPDGSGFSDFAETYAQHKRNARRYQHRLDSLGVKR
ncbi:endolytic transglycosylase MltG [Hymenobacter sp. BT770]|uniref:endolytic transglycosylase MltG n=1 Tax=Hymenobacter sp. BT770 TaxID=2886942 RepID=UPI001D112628|nr:endolytic transglycosylase MltG [Hymenobacter sp. BT770]MCC3152644.1 endolytic transglycosylase MltG [Hymenobacter sp. BT770]MDO3414717.1 endolytic transglycosylase MltG [Hymenobacter sp. BT770]